VSSAHFQLCRALLNAGHELDFYADSSFILTPGYESAAFTYIPVRVELRREFDSNRFAPSMRVLAGRLGGMRRLHRYCEHAMIIAQSRHLASAYDAALFLGMAPGPTITGVPTIVWPQSAPQNELTAVRGLSRAVARVSGLPSYLKLRLFYEAKDRVVWRWAHHHHLILASQAARAEAIAFGVPAERVCVAPYPIDLDRFAPSAIPTLPVRRVLCVGRLDPRKRIDLLVDAVSLLAARRQDFIVDVIGRDGYVEGYRAFVEHAGASLPITYTEAVHQSEIIDRLHDADIVVQPSEREEFGHAVAEALACGVPVVTGPTNRTGEYIPADGSAAFHRYSPESLADAIERALVISRDPLARDACRAAAAAFAADRVAETVAQFIRAAKP
jgi:glycosyltransferase involved in cell wall biosynthesis